MREKKKSGLRGSSDQQVYRQPRSIVKKIPFILPEQWKKKVVVVVVEEEEEDHCCCWKAESGGYLWT